MNRDHKKIFIVIVGLAVVVAMAYSFKLIFGLSDQLAAIRVAKTRSADRLSGNVMIRGDGVVHLTGIVVESVDGNRLIATGQIGEIAQAFIVNVDGQTSVVGGGGAAADLAVIKPGVVLIVTGVFQSFSPDLTVLAQKIRASGIRGDSTELLSFAESELRQLPPKRVAAVSEVSSISSLAPLETPLLNQGGGGGGESATSTEPEATTTEIVILEESATSTDQEAATTTEPVAEPPAETSTTTEPAAVDETASSTATSTVL